MKHIAAFLFYLCILAGVPGAQATDNSERCRFILLRPFLTRISYRQLGRLRDKLIDWGLTPTATYSAAILGNPVGGMRKGVKYSGLLNVYLDFDLEKLLKIGGTRFVVSGAWAFGENLSAKDIGNFFTVSTDFNGKFHRPLPAVRRDESVGRQIYSCRRAYGNRG